MATSANSRRGSPLRNSVSALRRLKDLPAGHPNRSELGALISVPVTRCRAWRTRPSRRAPPARPPTCPASRAPSIRDYGARFGDEPSAGASGVLEQRPHQHILPLVTAAAGSAPCARCSSRRAHRAGPAAAHHRGRAGPDGRQRAPRVGPGAARGASRGSAAAGPPGRISHGCGYPARPPTYAGATVPMRAAALPGWP